MADKSKTVIVKKIKKGHGEHHGGSWKVAYADFVTAMMAFFLLLWLISMVTPEKRAVLADYFRNFNVFQQGGRSFMEQSSGIRQEVKTSTAEPVTGEMTAEDLKEKLRTAIDDKLKNLRDQVMLDVTEGGVRIQIVDLEGRPMFPSGSAEPNDKCRQILKVVSENIKGANKLVAIEGHTDSAPFKGSSITNWELSTERASSARRELEKDGIGSDRIARVVGYADTQPLVKDNPLDSRNRRISIILLANHPKSESDLSVNPAAENNAAEPSARQVQPLPLIAPSAAPSKPSEQPRESTSSNRAPVSQQRNNEKKIDTGINPGKPIDIKPSIFPGLDR